MKGGKNMDEKVLNWLLSGDPSIAYQTLRDLVDSSPEDVKWERDRIENEGWGSMFLERANPEGGWGRDYYMPKWISTHYTLLDLKNLGINTGIPIIHKSIDQIFRLPLGIDGGYNIAKTVPYSDVCVNGMMLNIAAYFRRSGDELKPIVDYLLDMQLSDGGWNCNYYTGESFHSSLHTTIGVLEGLNEFLINDYEYDHDEIREAMDRAHRFMLRHQLYKSDHTGAVIDRKMLMLSYPSRWKYDILRCMDYFRAAGVKPDKRMLPAIDIIRKKRRSDGTWPVQAKHPGQVHFDMEKTGGPSRWNTLRALRVLAAYPG